MVIIKTDYENTTFSIDIQLSDIVATLKKKIESDEEFEADGQCLSFNGILLDDYRTLSHYGIEDGSVINMAFQFKDGVPQKGKFPVTVTVRTNLQWPRSNYQFQICVRLSDTVGQLKLRINEIKGIPPEDQCIRLVSVCGNTSAGKYLEDDMTLAEVKFHQYMDRLYLDLISGMQIGFSKKAQSWWRRLVGGGTRVYVVDEYYGRILLIYINLSETIEELKLILQEKTGIKVEHQDIRFDKIETRDCGTLAYYGVVNNSRLHLDLHELMHAKVEDMRRKSALHPDDTQIFVKTLTGKNIPIKAQSSNTIEELKFKIQDIEGIPPVQSHLVFRGISLKDERSVADYNITNNSVVNLVLKLGGD